MKSFERHIYNLVRFNPRLKRITKTVYQRLLAIFPVAAITTDYPISVREGHFFGFHDKTPWSVDNRFLLSHKYFDPLRLPGPDDQVALGYFESPDYRDFHELGTAVTWNWQMGSMLQWVGDTDSIIYNDFIDGQHKARIIDRQGSVQALIDRPVAAVSITGRWALSHSFIRLQKFARAYSYSNGDELSATDPIPADDGLFLLDLSNGEIRMLFSIADIANYPGSKIRDGYYHYFTHPLFSPDGERFIFFHRWVATNGQTWTRMFSSDLAGNKLHLFDTSGVVTHTAWQDECHILAYALKADVGDHYYLFKDCSDEYEIIGSDSFKSDGHPQFSPVNNEFITDTYPDRFRRQTLIKYNLDRNQREDLLQIRSPFKYSGDQRCDLHPRWNRDGTAISFDSSHTGTRSHCILKLDR